MKIKYDVVWGYANNLNEALNALRGKVGKKTEDGYSLQGGVSVAFNSGVYAFQTLVKEVGEND